MSEPNPNFERLSEIGAEGVRLADEGKLDQVAWKRLMREAIHAADGAQGMLEFVALWWDYSWGPMPNLVDEGAQAAELSESHVALIGVLCVRGGRLMLQILVGAGIIGCKYAKKPRVVRAYGGHSILLDDHRKDHILRPRLGAAGVLLADESPAGNWPEYRFLALPAPPAESPPARLRRRDRPHLRCLQRLSHRLPPTMRYA